MEPKLVVVGSVAYDHVETPWETIAEVLGGSATHFSLASELLVHTGVVAVVGDDFKKSDWQRMEHRGIDLTGLKRTEGLTFRWGGRYDEHLKERTTLFTHLNVFAQFSPEIPAEYRDAPYIFLANIDPDLQHLVLDQVNNPKWVGLDSMNFWITGKKESLVRLLARVHTFFLNDSEAFELTGFRDAFRAAAAIRAMGPKVVVLKKGEHGSVLFVGDEVFSVPALVLPEVKDPTGAGDTYAGGMAGTLARLDDLSPEAMHFAAVVGTCLSSMCVEQFGPDGPCSSDLEALNRRLELFDRQVRHSGRRIS